MCYNVLFDKDILLLRFLRNLRHSRGLSLLFLSLEALLDWLFLLFAISVTRYFYREREKFLLLLPFLLVSLKFC